MKQCNCEDTLKTDPIIRIDNLQFSYQDGTKVLEGIDLCINKGEFIGILGPNGSGKTTLLKLLSGLIKPNMGNVYLEGKNLRSIDRYRLFSRVSMVFQNPDDQLFFPTVSQDVAFGPTNMGLSKDEIEDRVIHALEAVEISEFKDKVIHNLSYGQKKRVCLAGVLAMEPDVILLDEPTAGLDPMGTSIIMHLLKRLNKEGRTMIMATHSVDLVPLILDRVAILNNGRIIIEGNPREVFSKPEIIRPARLRLPQIGHLFEILKKKDGFDLEDLPLTIGQARREIKGLLLSSRASITF